METHYEAVDDVLYEVTVTRIPLGHMENGDEYRENINPDHLCALRSQTLDGGIARASGSLFVQFVGSDTFVYHVR